MHDYRNRVYSSDLGRFLQVDPIGFAGDSGNLYRYVGNAVTRWSDPSGLHRSCSEVLKEIFEKECGMTSELAAKSASNFVDVAKQAWVKSTKRPGWKGTFDKLKEVGFQMDKVTGEMSDFYTDNNV